jgi:hypothetical protein
MPTFVYNPGIQVYIETTDKKTGKKRVLDVSDDVISGSVTRVANGVSSFGLQLQNSGRKYDFPHPVFQPNDRVIVNMKRVSWVRVLTGYLSQVPVFTIWPGQVTLTGACSLKRLQYWTWDPALNSTYALIDNALKQDQNNPDGGITAAFMALLDQVVGWDLRRVHVGAIPHDWFDFMLPVAQEVEKSAEAAAQAQQQNASALGADGFTSGMSNQGPVSAVPVLEGMPVPATRGKASQFGIIGQDFTASDRFANGKRITESNPFYCAMRWDYANSQFPYTSNAKPVDWFYGGGDPAQAKKLVVTNTRTGKQVIVYAASYGPGYTAAESKFAIDLGPQAMSAMGGVSGDTVTIGWASNQNVTPGPITGNEGFNNPQTTSDPQGITGTSQKPNSLRADGTAANVTGRSFVETGINLAQTHRIPYTEQFGGTHMEILTSANPPGLDCSSFVQWCLVQSVGTLQPRGVNTPLPRVVSDQVSWALNNGAKRIPPDQAMQIPGAVMVVASLGHTEISVGDGQHTVGAHHSGTFVSVETYPASGFAFGYLMPGVNYMDSTGHIVTGAGSSLNLSSDQVFSNGGVGVAQGPTAAQSLIPTDALGNTKIDKLFADSNSWVAVPSDLSGEAYKGANALQNDQQLFPYLDNLIKSSMRQWSSAPNGDIIAWFPDYYGVWGTAAVMYIEDIELMDFQVSWSDEALITHEFVVGALESQLDTSTGQLSAVAQDVAIDTRGIATIDLKALVGALFRYKPTDADMQKFRDYIYQRFGARVETRQVPGIYGPKAEFFLAVFNFMQRWSAQFSSNVPMTFMPELWPGMLIRLKRYGFQAYVQEVRHDFTVGQGGSFTTTATIVAPSEFGKDPLLSYLPQVTPYAPGTGAGVQSRNEDFRQLSPQLRRLLQQGIAT